MSDPARKDVWKMFDSISQKYDKTNRVLSFGMDQRWRKKITKQLPQKSELKILDLATGTGDQILAMLNDKASIIGIDLSNQMLEIAKQKLK